MNETEQNDDETKAGMADWTAPEQEKPDRFPTLEEIKSVFRILTKKPHAETAKVIDGKGVKVWELTTAGDLKGEKIEFTYNRSDEDSSGDIYVHCYADGDYVIGFRVAYFVDGQWKIIDNAAPYKSDEPMVKAPAEIPEPNLERREAEGEIEAVESLFEQFEATHSIEELLGLTKMTEAEAKTHPIREPARLDLMRIYELLKTLKDETDIAKDQLDALYARYQVLNKAVGRSTSKDIIEH